MRKSGVSGLFGLMFLLAACSLDTSGAAFGDVPPDGSSATGPAGGAGPSGSASASSGAMASGAGATGSGGAPGTGGSNGEGGAGGTGGVVDPPIETPVCDPDDASLILCYTFEGAVTDASSKGNTAVVMNVAFDAGIKGQAAKLDQNSDIFVDDNPAWDFDDFTVELWFNASSLPTQGRAMLLDSGGRLGLWIEGGSGNIICSVAMTNGQQLAFTVGVAKANTWMHVACVRSGATGKGYVDGDASAPVSYPASTVKTDAITGVGVNVPSGDHFMGLLDTVRVWSKSLTPSQICEAAGKSGC